MPLARLGKRETLKALAFTFPFSRFPFPASSAKHLKHQAPTVCMHAVSGSISLPFRGSFRLSLTVLVHYRSVTSI